MQLWWEEGIFKPTIGNESLNQDSNDSGVRRVNFTTSKHLIVNSMMFQHRKIHKYSWTSPDVKTHSQVDHIWIDRRWYSSILNYSLSGQPAVMLITIWLLQKLKKKWQ
jgi:hypothetical protein